MNVLVITEYYPPYITGGCEIACHDFVEALEKKGLSVTILTGKYGLDKEKVDGNVYRILKTASISPYTFFTSSRFNLNRVLLYQAFYYLNYSRTSALLKKKHFDLAYAWRLQNVTLAPFRVVTDAGLKTIFHIEDYWLLNTVQWLTKNYKFLRQLLLRVQTEKLTQSPMIFLSQSVKKAYKELFPESLKAPVETVGKAPNTKKQFKKGIPKRCLDSRSSLTSQL